MANSGTINKQEYNHVRSPPHDFPAQLPIKLEEL